MRDLSAPPSSKLIKSERVAILRSTYHGELTQAMAQGAEKVLAKAGLDDKDWQTFSVPGAYELPLASRRLLECGWDAVIALGVVIRGETDHYNYICSAVATGCMQVQLEFGRPVGFGVLTSPTETLAKARAGGQAGNKGEEAAQAVVAMLHFFSATRQ